MDVTSFLEQSCPNATSCQWSISGGTTLFNPPPPGDDNYLAYAVFKVDTGPGWIWGNSTVAADADLGILDFNVIGQSKDEYYVNTPKATPVKLSGVEAHECALWFWLQARYTNVSFGIAEQKVTAHWNQAQKVETFYDTLNFTNVPDEFNTEPSVSIGVSQRAVLGTYQDLERLLFGTVNPLNTAQIYFVDPDGNSIDGLKGLWYAVKDIDNWMNNLTKSMTNNVRLTGITTQINDTKYEGVAWALEAYIKVRWAWIIFPWALVILSITFLIVTVLENGKVKPWRSSASAMLYARLDEELQDVATASYAKGNGSTEELEERTVRLDTAAWVFRPASSRIA